MAQPMSPLASPIARLGMRTFASLPRDRRGMRGRRSSPQQPAPRGEPNCGADVPVPSLPKAKAKALSDLRAKGAGLLTQMGLVPAVTVAAWPMPPPGLGRLEQRLAAPPGIHLPTRQLLAIPQTEGGFLTTMPRIEKEPMKVQLPEDAAPLSMTLDPRLPAKKRVPASIGELCDLESFSAFEPASVKLSETLFHVAKAPRGLKVSAR